MISQTISHYKILEKLGEGGMGVVYKARDTHLDRYVAIKVLPPEKVADPERKKRFVQEAKAASALNHPNIITIYDIDQGEGIDFIAMEYVDGRTLDELIGRKGLKLSEALKVSVQMADALAAAHEAGIVHRDLKPGNVMVTGKGQVKVLDFGLAKLTETLPQGKEDATLTMKPNTEEGKIVGTVAYMSPEQAEGKKLDARSDIFSFGSVLYEMVTGQKAFQGSSKLSTLSAILHQEPKPINSIAGAMPADLEKLISRCLRKDPERRIRHMDDVKLVLEDLKEESDSGTLAGTSPAVRPTRPPWVWAGAALVVVAIALAAWLFRGAARKPQAALEVVPLTSYAGLEQSPSFSPDGSQVAFCWNGEKEDNFDIYAKVIGTEPPSRLTANPANDYSPAWSPDGRWIAFLRDLPEGKVAVLVVPPIGGAERRLTEIHSLGNNVASPFLAWSADSSSLIMVDKASPEGSPALFWFSIESGEKRQLTFPPPVNEDISPALSPDGRTLAFCRWTSFAHSDLYLLDLADNFRPVGEPRRLTSGKWRASSPAWTSEGRTIVFSAYSSTGSSLWKISPFRPGSAERLGSIGEHSVDVAIARQGNRLAYTQILFDSNIWGVRVTASRDTPASPRKFVSSTRVDMEPQFSPDGQRIAFVSDRSGSLEIWVCDREGLHAMQLTSFSNSVAYDPRWSPDGERLAFDASIDGQSEIFVVEASGGRPQRLTTHPATDQNPSWSKDGRWIYFDSDRSGGTALWKMPAQGGQAVPLRGNGYGPVESPDGKFLYYVRGTASGLSLWRIPMEGGEEQQVLESLSEFNNFAVVNDGIYFIPRPDPTSGYSIQFFKFASRSFKQIAPIEKPIMAGLTVSPDRQWFLFSQIDQQGSDLMLVENFR